MLLGTTSGARNCGAWECWDDSSDAKIGKLNKVEWLINNIETQPAKAPSESSLLKSNANVLLTKEYGRIGSQKGKQVKGWHEQRY